MICSTIVGKVGGEPDFREVERGKILNFRVKCNIRRKGEKSVQWVNCSMWGKRAESIKNLITKGRKVVVTGLMYNDKYTSNEGLEWTILRLDVKDIEIVGEGCVEEIKDNIGNCVSNNLNY